MTERLIVVDCKSIEKILIVGSNPALFIKRNITQAGSVSVLGTGSHVFESHYFEIFEKFLLVTEELIKKFSQSLSKLRNKFFIIPSSKI